MLLKVMITFLPFRKPHCFEQCHRTPVPASKNDQGHHALYHEGTMRLLDVSLCLLQNTEAGQGRGHMWKAQAEKHNNEQGVTIDKSRDKRNVSCKSKRCPTISHTKRGHHMQRQNELIIPCSLGIRRNADIIPPKNRQPPSGDDCRILMSTQLNDRILKCQRTCFLT